MTLPYITLFIRELPFSPYNKNVHKRKSIHSPSPFIHSLQNVINFDSELEVNAREFHLQQKIRRQLIDCCYFPVNSYFPEVVQGRSEIINVKMNLTEPGKDQIKG
ncbi:Hypothetical_protein [Hexamita inflata]|uniref:Hypothetical_protein n=1 Tax=Hexamita inflata TaxID=28002 RepID=A0AA86NK25_9EUKA|nr:Hypothetical protein HINF_LOCUS8321 [Hexamita inflata]